MEVGDILSYCKTGQSFASSAICAVSRNGAYNLDPVRLGEMKNRATANAIDGDAINKVGVPKFLPCTDVPREEAKIMGSNCWEAKPANLGANIDELAHWKKCYGDLWQLKIAFEKKNYR